MSKTRDRGVVAAVKRNPKAKGSAQIITPGLYDGVKNWLKCPVAIPAGAQLIVGCDPATAQGDYSCQVTMLYDEKSGVRKIMDATHMKFEHCELGPIKKKRVLEYTVDMGIPHTGGVQTVLRTFDRKAALEMHEKLHTLAVKLNRLGVDVVVEFNSESREI